MPVDLRAGAFFGAPMSMSILIGFGPRRCRGRRAVRAGLSSRRAALLIYIDMGSSAVIWGTWGTGRKSTATGRTLQILRFEKTAYNRINALSRAAAHAVKLFCIPVTVSYGQCAGVIAVIGFRTVNTLTEMKDLPVEIMHSISRKSIFGMGYAFSFEIRVGIYRYCSVGCNPVFYFSSVCIGKKTAPYIFDLIDRRMLFHANPSLL